MTRLKLIDLSKLHTKELGSLAATVYDKVQTLLTAKLIPQKIVDNLHEAIVTFNKSIGSKANTEETKQLHECDDAEDITIQELKGAAQGAYSRRQGDIHSAGALILTLIRRHGYEFQNFRIPVEIDTVDQLVSEINASPELTAAVVTIGAKEMVERLAKENAATKACWLKVQDHRSNNDPTSQEAVRLLRSVLSQTFRYLDTMTEVEPEVAKVVKDVNTIIDPFVTTIRSRATILANKKKEDANHPKDEKTPDTKPKDNGEVKK